jgi:DNA-binding IclR family transcriptional regulator
MTQVDKYTIPALDRGLDILEFLSSRQEGVTQSQIGKALDLSASAVFRPLLCLERRGFIVRKRPEDLFFLSTRMFELSHNFPPTARVLDAAMPLMRILAHRTGQSCHLGIYSDGALLVIAQVESPGPMGFSVRIGARFPIETTASGRVLYAFQAEDVQRQWLAEMPVLDDEADFSGRIVAIAARGYEEVAGESRTGVTDLSAPIVGAFGTTVAALTVPILASTEDGVDMEMTRAQLLETAAAITAEIGGSRDFVGRVSEPQNR